jgi:hypothetical protein
MMTIKTVCWACESPSKDAPVNPVLPRALMKEVIIHKFVNFVGSSNIVQIFEKEMELRSR